MENSGSNSPEFAQKKLHEASQAKHSATVLAVTLSTAAVGLVVLVFFALLDYWLMLVPSVRYGGLIAMCVLVGGGVYKLVKALKRPTPLKEAALDAEAIKPGLGCELSTAAEYLSGDRKANQEYEAELATALQANAAEHLKKVQLPYWERLIRPALIVAMLVLGAVFFSVLASGGFTAFKRAAMPWLNAKYTEVQVQPGNVEIPIGRDLEVKTLFTGRIPREPKFQWQDQGSPKWEFAALKRNEQGEYTYPLKNVRNSLKYRVSGSDAVSSEFTIEPYVPADVKEWQVELAPPAYTRLPKAKQETPEITALRGTVASIRIAPTTKLSKAQFRFKDGPAIDLHPVENGFWQTELKIGSDAEFTIDLADEKGRPDSNESVFKITALPDEVPKVEIAEPGQDTTAAATNTVAVKISAMDDYGLSELKLVYHRLGGPEEFVIAKRNGETNTEFTAEIPLSPLRLTNYQLVAYHALAVDNNTLDGPGIGKSEVYFIEITDKEGGECKCQSKGQKVNLLVIQKQIIADTIALGQNPDAQKMEDLALRQKDAVEFGRIYEKALASGTNATIASEMTAAIADMENAQRQLEQKNAQVALAPEESALARLYKIVGMMPELQDLPTVPPPPPVETAEKEEEEKKEEEPLLAVVLEEIKKKKKEEPNNEELAAALEEVKRLQEEQASLSLGIQPSEGESKSTKPPGGGGQTDIDRSGKKKTNPAEAEEMKLAANEQTDPQKAESKAKKDGKAQGKKPSTAKGKSGEGKAGESESKSAKAQAAKKATAENAAAEKAKSGSKPGDKAGEKPGDKAGQNGKDGEKGVGKEPQENEADQLPKDELAQREQELSKEAKALAEKLQRIAGKDARVGHGIPREINEAGEKMGDAASAMSQGDTETAGVHGAQASASLQKAVVLLENALLGRAQRVDVSNEEAPRQYEALISEYFKALSYDN
jgi:hypothetical protein